jgi:hypothetical protein
LPYANSYLTTGNYVSGAVDFPANGGVNGFITGGIEMSGCSTNADGSPADILAAWVYWETIVNDPAAFALGSGGTLYLRREVPRTRPHGPADQVVALTGPFASCFGPSGSTPSYTMFQMRADVRRFLPLQYDASGRSTASVW